MNLSVVIVNYRSWGCLETCLASLLSEAEGQPWEIIVVDNRSDDGQLDEFRARFPSVRFSESDRNGGFAYGCNRGAALASGKTLLFLNPDVEIEPGSLRSLFEARRAHPEIAILSTCQVDARGRLRKVFDMFPDKLTWFRSTKFLLRWLRPARYPDPRRPYSGLLEVDWVSGSVLMIDREDFDRLGGWREDFWMYVEDCDLCLRARRAGMRVACSGDLRVVHYHGGASRQTQEISILTRTEAIISKHLYAHLNFRGVDRVANQLCIFLAVVPKLAVLSLLDLLTLRQVGFLKTRAGVFGGLCMHYAHALRARSWCSRQVAA